MAQLLNNMNVWMVLYCAKQLLGLKKNKNPFPNCQIPPHAANASLKEINTVFSILKLIAPHAAHASCFTFLALKLTNPKPAQCKATNHCLSVELQAGAADVDEVGAAELEEIGAEDELADIARVAELSSCSRSSGPVLR